MEKQTFGKLYHVRHAMIGRCYNEQYRAYPNYGGRGISVCEDWLRSIDSFIDFSIKNGWSEQLQIDRINNDGDYEPSNVRFVTAKQNCRNRRNNVLIEINGEIKRLCEWADISGVGRATIRWRHKHGIRGNDLLKKP